MVKPVVPENDNGSDPEAKSAPCMPGDRVGLAAWMDCVTVELDRAKHDFNPDALHDLRVALRRCLSLADLHRMFDPLEEWGEMRKEGRRLFKRLGELRDTQVMMEWIPRLVGSQDPAGIQLGAHLNRRESELSKPAASALDSFDGTKWARWQTRLSKATLSVPLEDPIYQQFALERWQTAYDLHHQALRNRSWASFHRLRIGLKRFRYTVENFLPQRHEIWGKDLKLLQDALGELHDLFLLWQTALNRGVLADGRLRAQLHARIEEQRRIRIQTYREKAVGKESVWLVWRAGLPVDHELEQAALSRIRIWASYRDHNFARTLDVANLAMQLYDGLEHERIIAPDGQTPARSVLCAAAIMHNIGLDTGKSKRGKSGYRMIKKIPAPLGFSEENYECAALAVRYLRSAVIKPEVKPLARLSEEGKQTVQLTAAILNLADAFANYDNGKIQHLKVSRRTDTIVIFAEGYCEKSSMAIKLATARHSLEVVCQVPVLIRPLSE